MGKGSQSAMTARTAGASFLFGAVAVVAAVAYVAVIAVTIALWERS